MASEVNLPELGESVTEGTVTRWLKQVGDEVAVDEPLLEVSTDKVDTEIPSPVGGTLLEIRANEDDTVEVGAVLALVGSSDEAGGEGSPGDDAGGQTEEAAAEPAEQPEQQTDQQADQQWEQQPDQQPDQQWEQQPDQEWEQQPDQQPAQEPAQQPD